MKLAILLDTGKVYRLTRPRKEVSEALEAERCLIIDTNAMTYWDPEIGGDPDDIEPDNALVGEVVDEDEIDEDEVFESDDEYEEDAEVELESYDDGRDYT